MANDFSPMSTLKTGLGDLFDYLGISREDVAKYLAGGSVAEPGKRMPPRGLENFLAGQLPLETSPESMAIGAMTGKEYLNPLSNTVANRLRPYVDIMERRGWLEPFAPLQVIDTPTMKRVAGSGTASGATLSNPSELFVKRTAPGMIERQRTGLISEDYQANTLLHENLHVSLQSSGIGAGYGPKITQRLEELGINLNKGTKELIDKNLNPKQYSKKKEAEWAEERLSSIFSNLSPKEFEYATQDIPNYISPLKKEAFSSGIQKPGAKLKEEKFNFPGFQYEGVQEGRGIFPDQHVFTEEKTGSSFLIENPTPENMKAKAKEMQAKFAEENPRIEGHLNVALNEASKIIGYGRLKKKLTELLGDAEKVNRAFERAGIRK